MHVTLNPKAFFMKVKNVVILIPLLLVHEYLLSQNFFSQFYSSPLTVNPANTGKFLGDYRIGGVGRSGNNGLSLNNSKASFFCDTRILTSALPVKDKLAIGVAALSEKNTFYGIKNSYLLLSLAYHKGLDEDGLQQLSVGFQVNYSHRLVEPAALIFEDQLMNLASSGFVVINPDPNKEININYLDFNIGFGYQNVFNDKNILTVGVSVFHTNRPSRTFNGTKFTLSPQGCVQMGLENTVDDRTKLYFAIIISSASEKKVGDLFLSCMYQTKINESNYKICLGGSYRRNELRGAAFVPCLALDYNHFVLSMSYDTDISSKTTSQRGGFEVGMIYIGRKHVKK